MRGNGFIKVLLRTQMREEVGITGGGLFLKILTCLLFFFLSCTAWADDEPLVQEEEAVIQTEAPSRPDTEEIEQAIAGLSGSDPNLVEKIGWIQASILQLETKAYERLRKALDDRRKEFSTIEGFMASHKSDFITDTAATQKPPGEATDLPATEEGSLPKDIKEKIDSLILGANATVDDLRKRDELVATIAGIQDPSARYELLEYLETKETQSPPL
jgi:hypothetical protein